MYERGILVLETPWTIKFMPMLCDDELEPKLQLVSPTSFVILATWNKSKTVVEFSLQDWPSLALVELKKPFTYSLKEKSFLKA